MISVISQMALENSLSHGKALLKYIAPNDVGLTGSHQCGYYLPKRAWQAFTPHPPTKGVNFEHLADIQWQDGRVTQSRIVWYGTGTRAEYRMTRFGKDFPFLTPDCIGDLLVLIPTGPKSFLGFILDLEDDIEELQVSLGVEVIGSWTLYDAASVQVETEEDCIARRFRTFCSDLDDFPRGDAFTSQARAALENCVHDFARWSFDRQLMIGMEKEYELFRMAERRLCHDEIHRLFQSVDDFLSTANTIMNRRKSRAGRALENHVEYVLRKTSIPFEMRSRGAEGIPDVLIPGLTEYNDTSYPEHKLYALAIKTTCKDRWRQVLSEARRINRKYLLTMQPGISAPQLKEMHTAGLTLIVPQPIHSQYPRDSGATIITIEQFISQVQSALND